MNYVQVASSSLLKDVKRFVSFCFRLFQNFHKIVLQMSVFIEMFFSYIE
jgi:hypothetical protein